MLIWRGIFFFCFNGGKRNLHRPWIKAHNWLRRKQSRPWRIAAGRSSFPLKIRSETGHRSDWNRLRGSSTEPDWVNQPKEIDAPSAINFEQDQTDRVSTWRNQSNISLGSTLNPLERCTNPRDSNSNNSNYKMDLKPTGSFWVVELPCAHFDSSLFWIATLIETASFAYFHMKAEPAMADINNRCICDSFHHLNFSTKTFIYIPTIISSFFSTLHLSFSVSHLKLYFFCSLSFSVRLIFLPFFPYLSLSFSLLLFFHVVAVIGEKKPVAQETSRLINITRHMAFLWFIGSLIHKYDDDNGKQPPGKHINSLNFIS